MKLKLISIFAMILLVFTVIGQEETETPPTEAPPTDGKCASDVQVCDVSSVSGPVEIQSGAFKLPTGETIQISGKATIEIGAGGEITSFTGNVGPTTPLKIGEMNIVGDDIDYHGGTLSIGYGMVNDVALENAKTVTVVNGIIDGRISGTGRIGGISGVSVLDADFSVNTDTGEITISCPQSQDQGVTSSACHAVLPSTFLNGNIMVKPGATIEVIDGSGLILTDGAVIRKNGKTYVNGGVLNGMHFGEFDAAFEIEPKAVSVCTAKPQCDTSGPFVVVSQEGKKLEIGNLENPIRFDKNNKFFTDIIDSYGKERLVLLKGGSATLTARTGIPPLLAAENCDFLNGDISLSISGGKVIETRNVAGEKVFEDFYITYSRSTIKTEIIGVDKTGKQVELIPGSSVWNIVTDNNGGFGTNVCLVSPTPTGRATNWITGMDAASCMQIGKCTEKDFPHSAQITNQKGVYYCGKDAEGKDVNCETLIKAAGFLYSKEYNGYKVYEEKSYNDIKSNNGQYSFTKDEMDYLKFIVVKDGEVSEGSEIKLQNFLRAQHPNSNIVVNEVRFGDREIVIQNMPFDKSLATVKYNFREDPPEIVYTIDNYDKYLETALKAKDNRISKVTNRDGNYVVDFKSRTPDKPDNELAGKTGRYDPRTSTVTRDIAFLEYKTAEEIEREIRIATSTFTNNVGDSGAAPTKIRKICNYDGTGCYSDSGYEGATCPLNCIVK